MKKQGGMDGVIEPKFRKFLHYAHLLCGDEEKARSFLHQCASFAILENNVVSRESEIEILVEIRDRFYEKKKNKSRPQKSSQLELFDGEEWGRKQKKEKELFDHLVPRARVFLASSSVEEREEILSIRSSRNQDTLTENLIRFVEEITEEGENVFLQLDDINEREILHRVGNFILENCSDEEALTIEKNCRENPDWQAIKVCMGRGWEFLQKAAREWNDVDEQYVISAKDTESVVERTDPVDEDSAPSENVPVLREETVGTLNRWESWKIYFAVGILTSLVGYFGWQDKISPEKESIDRNTQDLTEVNQTVKEEITPVDYQQVAEELAQRNIEKLFDQRTRMQIEEINKSLESLPQFIDQEILTKPVVSDEQKKSEEEGYSLRLFELSQVKEAKESFLFLPDRESLGKITIEEAEGENILFYRSDWNKPGRSFALNAEEYEIRSVLQNKETVILLGNVKPEQEETKVDGEEVQNRYQMLVIDAWKLNLNQQRVPLKIR
ncbi:MAG: hypothetical protein VW312_02390 [Opitutales bacterium]